MKYAQINPNDIVNGEGVSVSLFVQGCGRRCRGCFNKASWDFEGGEEFTLVEMKQILDAISANGVKRNFSILGGEPLDLNNIEQVLNIIKTVRITYPNIKIYLWTGYYLDEIWGNSIVKDIMLLADYIIDGPFEEDKKDYKYLGKVK